MSPELKQKLDNIVGKQFNYKGKNITIEKYKDVRGANVVVFCPNPLNFLMSEVEGFLQSLLDPVVKQKHVTAVYVPKNELAVFEPTKENKVIKETLLDTLIQIKKNPEYIAQATAICNVVDKMVQVQKNEIHMLAIINKIK
ncbi:hypothetical protein CJ739_106 [Mariniflexile rhizosphaerae]|uniref:hypothetical protein n=1 Tax=unclassified Mariniflexile TaxID=2643887 RepID=UPI000E33424B|nr:hypothetical protein [Mariniflexile sp. TRM1-10]AXP79206.1 hypothetical protein CJ739_106 [Mariniflexile sp. TRM1-10]